MIKSTGVFFIFLFFFMNFPELAAKKPKKKMFQYRLPPPGCSNSGAGGHLHPRHDGRGLHGSAEKEA